MSTWADVEVWIAWRQRFFETHRQMSLMSAEQETDIRLRWQALELLPFRTIGASLSDAWDRSGSDFVKAVTLLPQFTGWRLPPQAVVTHVPLDSWESPLRRYERRMLAVALTVPGAQLLKITVTMELDALRAAFDALQSQLHASQILLWTETLECKAQTWTGIWYFLSESKQQSPMTKWASEENAQWISLN